MNEQHPTQQEAEPTLEQDGELTDGQLERVAAGATPTNRRSPSGPKNFIE